MTASEIANAWFENVWDKGDGRYIDKLLAPQCKVVGLSDDKIENAAQFNEFFTRFNIAFTNIRATVDQVIDSSNQMSGIATIHAKHRRSGLIASYKVAFFGIIESGKIVELIHVIDNAKVLSQLNMVDKDFVRSELFGKS